LQESVSSENVDSLMIQVKESSIVAYNVVCYKKTANALILDIEKEQIPVAPDFFSKVSRFEKEIEELESDYNKAYLILKDKIVSLMDKYDKKLSEFSKIPNAIKRENNNSFGHSSEMLDVSV